MAGPEERIMSLEPCTGIIMAHMRVREIKVMALLYHPVLLLMNSTCFQLSGMRQKLSGMQMTTSIKQLTYHPPTLKSLELSFSSYLI